MAVETTQNQVVYPSFTTTIPSFSMTAQGFGNPRIPPATSMVVVCIPLANRPSELIWTHLALVFRQVSGVPVTGYEENSLHTAPIPSTAWAAQFPITGTCSITGTSEVVSVPLAAFPSAATAVAWYRDVQHNVGLSVRANRRHSSA